MILEPGTHVFYETDTGKPVRVKQIYKQLDIDVPESQSVYTLTKGETAPNGDTDRLIDGVWSSIGEAPSKYHAYDWDASEWVLNTDKALSALAAYRWQVETGGYLWNDYLVASDDRAQTKLTQVALAITAGTRTSVRWKFSDGVWRDLTATEFISMAEALDAHCDLCFACEEVCKARIVAGEYDIETIWSEEWLTLNDTQTAGDEELTAETEELTATE